MAQSSIKIEYNYKDHRDIEPDMVDYILSVADVSNIYSLSLEEINEYLNSLEEYCDEQYQEPLLNRSA